MPEILFECRKFERGNLIVQAAENDRKKLHQKIYIKMERRKRKQLMAEDKRKRLWPPLKMMARQFNQIRSF